MKINVAGLVAVSGLALVGTGCGSPLQKAWKRITSFRVAPTRTTQLVAPAAAAPKYAPAQPAAPVYAAPVHVAPQPTYVVQSNTYRAHSTVVNNSTVVHRHVAAPSRHDAAADYNARAAANARQQCIRGRNAFIQNQFAAKRSSCSRSGNASQRAQCENWLLGQIRGTANRLYASCAQ